VLAALLLTGVRASPAAAGPEEPKPFVVSVAGDGDAKTIAEALQKAPAGTAIVVRPGVYREMLNPSRAVELRAEKADVRATTMVEGTAGPALTVSVAGVAVRGLTFRVRGADAGGTEAAVVVEGGGAAAFDACGLSSEWGAGIKVKGTETRATLRDCLVEATALEGVAVDGATVDLERTTVTGAKAAGVALRDHATLRGKEVVVADAAGHGVSAVEGSVLRLEGGQVRGSGKRGVFGADGATSVSLRRVVFEGGAHDAVTMQEGSSLEAIGCEMRGIGKSGVVAYGPQTKVVVRTTTIRGCKASGMLFEGVTTALLEDCVLAGAELVGIEIRGSGDVTMRRCMVSESRTGSDLAVHDPCTVHGEGCEFSGAKAAPEVRAWDRASVDLKGGFIHDGLDDGVYVESDAIVTLTGVEIRGNALTGITAYGGKVVARECKIRKNKGAGVSVRSAGSGTFEKCELTGNLSAWEIEDPARVVRKANKPPN
jgi:hypothetical protein